MCNYGINFSLSIYIEYILYIENLEAWTNSTMCNINNDIS